MKKYTQEELQEILRLHELWLDNEECGVRADLSNANLTCADLSFADLRRANLRGADLRFADLRRANLRGADLSGTDLRQADPRLKGANLEGVKK
jgi:uncharacterized protein YjbI with pentapeptide repeats